MKNWILLHIGDYPQCFIKVKEFVICKLLWRLRNFQIIFEMPKKCVKKKLNFLHLWDKWVDCFFGFGFGLPWRRWRQREKVTLPAHSLLYLKWYAWQLRYFFKSFIFTGRWPASPNSWQSSRQNHGKILLFSSYVALKVGAVNLILYACKNSLNVWYFQFEKDIWFLHLTNAISLTCLSPCRNISLNSVAIF